jgi:carbon storage regulator
MLVLSRKPNEKIIIDDQIEIMIVEVRGDKVRIGITAPRDIVIQRSEILERIAAELAAGQPAADHQAEQRETEAI